MAKIYCPSVEMAEEQSSGRQQRSLVTCRQQFARAVEKNQSLIDSVLHVEEIRYILHWNLKTLRYSIRLPLHMYGWFGPRRLVSGNFITYCIHK
jgi:hypothetical protein